MVQILRKPPEDSLSPARWEFVKELWVHYEAAGRPTLDAIADNIDTVNFVHGTDGNASTETIRRMLRGLTVPAHWSTAQVAIFSLCDLAGYNPKEERENHFGDEHPSPEEHLRGLWNKALDDPNRGKPFKRALDDPWGAGYSDEPPF